MKGGHPPDLIRRGWPPLRLGGGRCSAYVHRSRSDGHRQAGRAAPEAGVIGSTRRLSVQWVSLKVPAKTIALDRPGPLVSLVAPLLPVRANAAQAGSPAVIVPALAMDDSPVWLRFEPGSLLAMSEWAPVPSWRLLLPTRRRRAEEASHPLTSRYANEPSPPRRSAEAGRTRSGCLCHAWWGGVPRPAREPTPPRAGTTRRCRRS
jgi:hypothetical protein